MMNHVFEHTEEVKEEEEKSSDEKEWVNRESGRQGWASVSCTSLLSAEDILIGRLLLFQATGEEQLAKMMY